jgi:ubiquinone/menaquinone biosynthesis C-methylase UbiE
MEKLTVPISRDNAAFHDFLRATRNHMDGTLVSQLEARLRQQHPELDQADLGQVSAWVDDLPEYQIYAWMFRHLQRFKYSWPQRGLLAMVEASRQQLDEQLEASSGAPELRLDPNLVPPEYFRAVDFHQHPNGVTGDSLAGVVYELGRRTTVPQHGDPNQIYRLLFDSLPQRPYQRVLDWGVGHGAGLLTFKHAHPQSECYGVDLSAPCLKLAQRRASEQGQKLWLSQQNLEDLDFEANYFDLAFHMFMLHEIPANCLRDVLAEVHRVLAPGGLFAGIEFHRDPDNAVQGVLQTSHGWLNNEAYAVPWYSVPIEALGREVGFSKVTVEPFAALMGSVRKRKHRGTGYWQLIVMEK